MKLFYEFRDFLLTYLTQTILSLLHGDNDQTDFAYIYKKILLSPFIWKETMCPTTQVTDVI